MISLLLLSLCATAVDLRALTSSWSPLPLSSCTHHGHAKRPDLKGARHENERDDHEKGNVSPEYMLISCPVLHTGAAGACAAGGDGAAAAATHGRNVPAAQALAPLPAPLRGAQRPARGALQSLRASQSLNPILNINIKPGYNNSNPR